MGMTGKILQFGHSADDRNGAEGWFARVSDPACPAADRDRFQHWLDADPAHARDYAAVQRLWDDGGDTLVDPAVVAAAHAALHGTGHPARARWVPAIAAAAVLMLAIGSWFSWRALQPAAIAPGVRYATATGQQRTLQLSDGSTLMLDTDSAVLVRFSPAQRHVELLRGRAQFDVYHDQARAFSVTAAGGTVTDIGTVFQMQLYAGTVDVVLLQGKVGVATAANGHARTASLQAGEQLQYGRDGVIGPIEPVDTSTAQGWTHGKLFVHDWTLARLLTAMNRYSDTKLEIDDPSLGETRISGVFNTGDQDTLLQVLQAGWPIKARRDSATRIMLSRATPANARPSTPR